MLNFIFWWAAILILGLGFWPLANLIFGKFRDGGWLFSKVIGLLGTAALLWTLNCMRLLPFTHANTLLAAAVCIFLNLILFILLRKRHPFFRGMNPVLILFEELLFAAILAAWIWIIGFKPDAYGTEKFMDYAFLTSMIRSSWMPFADPWYDGIAINYYYGGQFIAAFLIKLTDIPVGDGYTIMRATVTSFSFMLPFSLVSQMVTDRTKVPGSVARGPRNLALWSGLLGGCAVAFAGNFHYVIYGIILPLYNKLTGALGKYSYWFPDSTRYIGYNPVTDDKTIHEFPAYSSVLGDLHAHFLNIMFVVTVTAIVYAWARGQQDQKVRSDPSSGQLLKEALFSPAILLIGFFTGIFRWTNYWDFPIYAVVCGAVIFFMNMRKYHRDPFRFFVVTMLQFIEIWIVGYAAALPFTLKFRMISSEVALTHSHSAFYQLVILWGFPTAVVLAFFFMLLGQFRRRTEKKKEKGNAFVRLLCYLDVSDVIAIIFGFCAIGLVLLPEVIYVKDIYGGENYRANTMFKLTYQAFILFGICMGYMLVRAFSAGRKAAKTASVIGMLLLVITVGYTGQACISWFGNVFDASARKSTNASIFVYDSFKSDLGAVNWLNKNVTGQPVVLEANGDSYSDYGRISTATGLPTVLGWYVHEWLWRNNTDALNTRVADIKTIYTSTDEAAVKALIEKYNISYIYIGKLEREKFPDLNDTLLQKLGSVAYSDGETTYIMKVK